MRGLKQESQEPAGDSVASHPSRVRGLKLKMAKKRSQIDASHPSRVRGLKLKHTVFAPGAQRVAPLAGAWIETVYLGI